MIKTQIQTFRCAEFEMNYAVFGSGSKNFIMLPGLSIKPVTLSADVIAENYALFADEYKVYVFDRRRDFPDDYSIHDMASDTAFVLRSLGLFDSYIFGVSQGGMIAQYICAEHPELSKKLILASTSSRSRPDTDRVFSEWSSLAAEGDVVGLNRAFFRYVYSNAFIDMYIDVFKALEKTGTREELRKFSILSKAGMAFDAYSYVDRIKCPTLVIGAGNDRIMTTDASIEIAQKMGCELYIYPDAAHAVYDENPEYKDRIYSFFAD